MRWLTIAAAATVLAFNVDSAVGEATLQTRGKIDVAPNAALVAVSTDPVVQRVLNDDFYAARRRPSASTSETATITVTVTQQALEPGVSLEQIAPGDPGVVALLRAAGAEPPPIGDSGSRQMDPYETAARIAAQSPEDPSLQQLRQQQAFERSLGLPGAGPSIMARGANGKGGYDTVTIARVTVDSARAPFVVVAVAHPGDDDREVKKLVAEEIANAALH